MKTMKWLLRREFWEHKGSMFWAPVVLAGIVFATIASTLVYGLAMHGIHATVNGQQVTKLAMFRSLPMEMRSEVVQVATSSYLFSAAPLFILLSFVAFFYCLGALYDERRDRSILFWKSLPASDSMTVLSKVVTAACVAPLITVAAATALALALLLLACTALAFNGVNLFGMVLTSPSLYMAPLALLSLVPVYVLWALPTIGWLLLVSSWARSKVFLWAVGTPLIALVLAKWISFTMSGMFGADVDLVWIVRDAVARLLSGVVPGIWFSYEGISPAALVAPGHKSIDLASVVSQSWLTLAGPDVWVGVAAGALMIFGAIRMRRWRDEG
jgi:ABC-2 type transport system permease protein